MRIAGQSTLEAAPEAVWPLIFDPRTLLQLLPGCDQIESVAPGEYRGRMTLRLQAISGLYDVYVNVLRAEEPCCCEIEGQASGPAGTIRGRASFTLHPEGAHTRVAYQGEAQISGPLASMNARFVEGVAQTLIRQGLARLPELARAEKA